MILTIDCGNTHTVLGCVDEDGVKEPVMRIETNRKKTMYEYAIDIDRVLLLCKVEPQSFSGVIISSVVPTVTDALRDAVKLITGQDALIVGAGIKSGIRICIDDPGTIAADLVATAVAAKRDYPLPCAIIDMGTATTITVVSGKGDYIGGVIMPGVGISMDALTSGTSLLPSIDVAPPKKVIATATIDSMKAGIIYGTAGSLDGILDHFENEIGEFRSIIATGGLAHLICPYARHKIKVDEYMLLRGLYYIWKNNTK